MSPPILGTLMAIGLIGVILPERLACLMSPVLARSREMHQMLLAECPWSDSEHEDDPAHWSYCYPVNAGVCGIALKQEGDEIDECLSCGMPFRRLTGAWIWKETHDLMTNFGHLHPDCAQAFISLRGFEKQACDVIDLLKANLGSRPVHFRRFNHYIQGLEGEIAVVLGKSSSNGRRAKPPSAKRRKVVGK